MKTIADKTARATEVAEKVSKIKEDHPKEWDKYIEKRRKLHKEQTNASQKRK